MEKQTEILVVATHEGILATILRLLNNNQQWAAKGVSSLAEAKEAMASSHFDLILLGGGLTEAEEEEVKALAASGGNPAKVTRHFGGGSGLLFTEIYEALSKH